MIVLSKLSGRVYEDVYLEDGIYRSKIDDGLELDKKDGERLYTIKEMPGGIRWIKYDHSDRSIESHVNHIVSDGNTTLIAQHAVFNGKYSWHINESHIDWVKYYSVINLPEEEGVTNYEKPVD